MKLSNEKYCFSQLTGKHLLVAVSMLMLVTEPNLSKSHTIYLGYIDIF